MDLVIAPELPSNVDVVELLERHLGFARATSPACHVHALDLDGLLDPSVTFLTARREGELLGVGAIRELAVDHGELKSMHTRSSSRGSGVGRAMVTALLDIARSRHYRRVSLETGTQPAFAPARALYLDSGFVPCPPFGDYTANEHSACMTLMLGDV